LMMISVNPFYRAARVLQSFSTADCAIILRSGIFAWVSTGIQVCFMVSVFAYMSLYVRERERKIED
jgi:hypothetical protein